ncbi:DDT domain-containing protein PTM-like isoform X2 [Lycium barbarum]|uniref:DDT domain-containing protein PTM-like isoform X2 n=1 Tax=Lycium barbarum TaxID=112863 RepID=UPI00293EC5E1|nr:DDT domain-containing protein PTM-like isoform X2 [Lycium barbarum]
MEAAVDRSERRGRKRRRNDVQNVKVDGGGKKGAVVLRSKALLGRYVTKELKGSGIYLGKIIFYDTGLYKVIYEDGDFEDLDSSRVKKVLFEDDELNGQWLDRKKKLDELVASREVLGANSRVEYPTEPVIGVIDKSEAKQLGCDSDSSDLSEDYMEQDFSSEMEVPLFPAPQLPPSSDSIGIPEEYVSYLLSVYSFLRSFSIRLFLCPFGLDDFVGALNCSAPNTLLDSVHVALMSALRRHLRKLSSDGSVLASKCLRDIDWSLLDTMTWPVYLVHYLTVMGYTDEPGWKGFYTHTLQREYYLLPAGRKIMVLQILCDDVLYSEELRAEVDMREESEVDIESDKTRGVASVSAPRIVHPRYAKTTACKEQEAIELCKENHDRKKCCSTDILGSKDSGEDIVSGVDQNINSDECRLCGMEGTLLCCDGCPSSYHARCIGVSKMHIPEGTWYCPECRINEIEPKIMRGTTLKGGELFGVDSYGQIFMGTCSHLLVLKALAGADSIFRYYNEKDIPKVLQALNANVQHSNLYLEICKAITQHWKIPGNVSFPDGELSVIGSDRPNGAKCGSPERENTGSCVTEFGSEDASLSNFAKEPMLNKTLGAVIQPDGICYQVNNDSLARQNAPIDLLPSEQVGVKYVVSAGSVGQQVVPSERTQPDDAKLVELATCTSRSSSNSVEQVNSNCTGIAVSLECESACGRPSRIGYRKPTGGCLYIGSSFRPQRYINSYLHGDFAASAAANLAELSHGENHMSHASNNRRKLSANVLLQAKAFSSSATRFFWPNTEKKVVEVPRERCSWCFNCEAAATSKKGCLLNAAASNAIKGAVKILTGLRSASGGDGNLHGIATYIILMEESLTGLTVGPFLSTAFRKQWRKQAEEATSFAVIKSILLEFEENIRFVAFSGDWFKLVDGGASESSISHSAAGAVESSLKHKPGRRGRKPSSMVKVTADACQDKRKNFTWWRAGMLSKLIYQKATLPRSMLKKAARHGGRRKIPGIYYAEGSGTAKRSRQLVWRAAVDVCKTISQLALQVRYLDMHVRWSDLVSPEQSLLDGKVPESEASAFRNASICHKRITGSEVRYSVAFGNQKHLPSRVKKSIIEVEESQEEGKEKYWLSESRIPLYIIKNYEENLEKNLPSANKLTNAFPKLQKRCLVASCKDIFSYLAQKRDGNDKHCCASCEVDVLLRNAVKCNTCQGLCHKQCTISSTVIANEEVEFMTSCKQCYKNRALTQAESSNESPTSPLLMQGKDILIPASARKGGKVGSCSNPTASTATQKHSSKVKPASSNLATKTKPPHWGVIWRKQDEDTGDFRFKHILLKGNSDRDSLRPSCRLCCKPYDPYLMYIRCETCTYWYHAEAVKLEESKISEVVGFKCCRCRRIRMPICPYLDPKSKKQLEEKRMCSRASKMDSRGIEPYSGFISELQKDEDMATPSMPLQGPTSLEDNKHLASAVEELTEHFPVGDCERNAETISVPGQREQPVRTHIENHQTDLESSSELPTALGGNIVVPKEEMSTHVERGAKQPVRRHIRLDKDSDTPFANNPLKVDLSTPSIVGRDTSRYSSEEAGQECQDMEFEPQTCFSFDELIASDDLGPLEGVDSSGTLTKNVETSSKFLPYKNADTSYFKHEPAISTISAAAFAVPCKICSRKEPLPNLCCEICDIWIHHHCSPWNEEESGEDDWKCGNCREWR